MTPTKFRIIAVDIDGRELPFTPPFDDLLALLRQVDLRAEGWFTSSRLPILDYLKLEDDSLGDWTETLREHVNGIDLPADVKSWALDLCA